MIPYVQNCEKVNQLCDSSTFKETLIIHAYHNGLPQMQVASNSLPLLIQQFLIIHP